MAPLTDGWLIGEVLSNALEICPDNNDERGCAEPRLSADSRCLDFRAKVTTDDGFETVGCRLIAERTRLKTLDIARDQGHCEREDTSSRRRRATTVVERPLGCPQELAHLGQADRLLSELTHTAPRFQHAFERLRQCGEQMWQKHRVDPSHAQSRSSRPSQRAFRTGASIVID